MSAHIFFSNQIEKAENIYERSYIVYTCKAETYMSAHILVKINVKLKKYMSAHILFKINVKLKKIYEHSYMFSNN